MRRRLTSRAHRRRSCLGLHVPRRCLRAVRALLARNRRGTRTMTTTALARVWRRM